MRGSLILLSRIRLDRGSVRRNHSDRRYSFFRPGMDLLEKRCLLAAMPGVIYDDQGGPVGGSRAALFKLSEFVEPEITPGPRSPSDSRAVSPQESVPAYTDVDQFQAPDGLPQIYDEPAEDGKWVHYLADGKRQKMFIAQQHVLSAAEKPLAERLPAVVASKVSFDLLSSLQTNENSIEWTKRSPEFGLSDVSTTAFRRVTDSLLVGKDGRFSVEIETSDVPSLLDVLHRNKVIVEHVFPKTGIVSSVVAISDLSEIASLEGVKAIRGVSGGVTRAGSVFISPSHSHPKS